MADEMPQFQDEYPSLENEIRPLPVESEAQGYDAFARVLGSLASSTEQKTTELLGEQSNAMYINSVSNAEQIKTNAKINMLQNPSNAPKIAQQTEDQLDTLQQNTMVNKQDRVKLQSYISGVNNEVNLSATETEVQQRQRDAAFTFYANWPDQLKAYQDALISDPQKADQLHDSMMENLHSLVSIGAIHPVQAGSAIQTMSAVVDTAKDHFALYGNPNATAKDYHTLTANPLNDNKNNPNAPINESTGWMIDYYNTDRSMQGVLSDISNRKLPNPQVFDNLTPEQRQHAIMAVQGTQIADGMINSGEPYPVLQQEYKNLTEKGRILNYQEQATRNALAVHLQQLQNGNYLQTITQTPAGNAIMKNFVTNNEAIQNAPIDDDKKTQFLLQNKNNMVDQAIAYGQAHNVPSQYIQPIPQTEIANVQNAFVVGQNPASVISLLGQYNKQNQVWVANAMKDPTQRMIVQGIAFSDRDVAPQMQLDMITANQKGRDFNNLKLDPSEEGKLKTRIIANLKDQTQLLDRQYGFADGQQFQGAMINSTLRLAKYYASQNNDLTMSDANKYVDQACQFYTASFKPTTGSNYSVNTKQLATPLTSSDLDMLASYSTNQGMKYIKTGFKNNSIIDLVQDRNPLTMRISPTNDVQAVDSNGQVYYSEPLTVNLMNAVRADHAKQLQKQQPPTAEQLGQLINANTGL